MQKNQHEPACRRSVLNMEWKPSGNYFRKVIRTPAATAEPITPEMLADIQ